MFGTGDYKSTKNMTDEELQDIVRMLRVMRASSVVQAQQSIKRRAERRVAPKQKKTVSLDAIAASLSPELRIKFMEKLLAN